MKKIGTFIFIVLFPQITFAADRVIEENTIDGSIFDLLARARGFLMGLVGALAALFIIFAGLKYIGSAGNPQRAEEAKKTLTYAVIGLIFYLISDIVFSLLTGNEIFGLFK